jgi:cobalt-zinc-cadmium efflux system protein
VRMTTDRSESGPRIWPLFERETFVTQDHHDHKDHPDEKNHEHHHGGKKSHDHRGHQDHDHGGHHHNHVGSVSDAEVRKAVTLVLIITAVFMFVEAAAGFWTRSLALLSDSAHMLTDVAALAMALFSFRLSLRPRTASHTFGFRRVEVIGALLNGIILVLLAFALIWQAIIRFRQPEDVLSGEMLIVAVLGLGVNLLAGFILMKGSRSNLAMKGAYLHVLGDAVSSVGAIIAALLIRFQGWLWADAAASIVVAVIILISASGFFRETLRVLLQGTPLGLDTAKVENSLLTITGVTRVRDLHLWTLTLGHPILTVHIVKESRDHEDLLVEIQQLLVQQYRIHHSTIQISTKDKALNCDLE